MAASDHDSDHEDGKRLGRGGGEPPGWRPRAAAGAALAAVLLTVFVVRDAGRLPGSAVSPGSASARPVSAMPEPAAPVRSLAGEMIENDRLQQPPVTTRTRFLLTDRGDQRLTTLGGGDRAYRVATATEITLNSSDSDGRTEITTGLASGIPDGGPDDRTLRRASAAIVAALQAAGDPRVAATSYDGRPAWRMRARVPVSKLAGPGASGDLLDVVVDQETGFPVSARETLRGKLLRERRVERLSVNAPVPAGAFTLAVPRRPELTPEQEPSAGPSVLRFRDRYRRVPLSGARAIVGYAPLAPGFLPAGYRRAETRVLRRGGSLTGRTGNEGGNPISRDVVVTAYRRGLQRMLITSRRRGRGAWSDPLGAGEGVRVTERPLRLTAGALAGGRARLILDPQAIPHAWVLTSGLVVTVGGDLSRDEIVKVVTSLERRR